MELPRRNFLTSLGGLVAASALPSFAADDPKIFPARGRFERLELSYQHIHLGLKEPFSILHISDTHLTACDAREPDKADFAAKRQQTFGGCQEESLRDSLAWAKNNVDYVVHTGDLIEFQTEANYDLVRKYFGETAGTMFGAPGNHEYQRRIKEEGIRNTDEYNALSRATLNKVFPYDVTFQSTVVKGVNFICLEQVYGFVLPSQVARFKDEVKKGLPIILCMHVPFFSDHIWRSSMKFWRNAGRKFRMTEVPAAVGDYKRQLEDPVTRDFLAYLKQEPLLRGILCGHLHIDVQDRFSPTAMQYVVGGNFIPHGEEILFT